MSLNRGSQDDKHDLAMEQGEIPGLTTPEALRAVAALKKLNAIREKKSATMKGLREEEQEALQDALDALDEIGSEMGTLGPAEFQRIHVERLRLKFNHSWRPRKNKGSADGGAP